MDDIFGPEPSDTPQGAAPAPPSSGTNLEEFDDIFGNSDTPVEKVGADSKKAKDASSAAAPGGGSGLDEFDDIFGDSAPAEAAAEQLAVEGSKDEAAAGSGDKLTEEEGGGEEEGGDSAAQSSDTPSSSAARTSGANGAGGDKEFLDFLYDKGAEEQQSPGAPAAGDERLTAAAAASAAAPAEESETGADSPGGPRSPSIGSPLGEEGSFLEISSPTAGVPQVQAEAADAPALPPAASHPTAAPPASETAAGDPDEPKPASTGAPAPPALESTVRKEKVEVLRPLPEDPASALHHLAAPEKDAAAADEVDPEADGAAAEPVTTEEDSAADDVGYVRRLCAATGGFLPADLRPVVWGLVLGRGRKPEDAAFVKWRAQRRENPSSGAAAASNLDLRNDCLALARRLCEGSGGGERDDPEAMASDIEEVLTFYCTRRSEAYEPVLCAVVGPLFCMGLDPPAVSALLNPLIGSLTLFLGRGMTHVVRDLAWAHAHRRLHDLCTYHDPELVQHLNRSFPGWEMPLPAASVSRAETSALDQQAAAMVDDLESSLEAFVPRRRASIASSATQGETAGAGAGGGGGEGSSGTAEGRPPRADGQGLVEPSLLVAAHAGLGASAPLGSLLPLWDYLLVRHDKHFGFFLVLAALLRRRDELLAASGLQLRLLLAETLSPAAMATLLVAEGSDGGDSPGTASPLARWCAEAEALDVATPESFRHHLALIGEIAEAEYEAAVRTRAQKVVETGGVEGATGASTATTLMPPPAAVGPSGGKEAAKGLNHPSLLRMRSMMKSAGDKLAADLKNLKLARSNSDSPQSAQELAAPIELSLPQLCLAVSAKELRQALSFFAVDCRPKQQVDAGRFPTAYHLDPSAMDNPEELAETIMPVFEPLRRRTHVCLVGSGDGHLRARGLGARDGQQGIGSQKAARDEYSYVNTCALFFIKRGFPFVSVLEGGFAAAHELVMDTVADSDTDEGNGDAALSTAIVDHNPAACRLCLPRKPPAGAGAGGTTGGTDMVTGMLFPPASPLWARLGAADASAHGPAALAVDSGGNSNSDKQDGGGGGGSSSPFFPAKSSQSPGTEKTSSSSHSSVSAKSAGGDGGGDGSGHSTGAPPAPAPAPVPAPAPAGSNLFKGGAMFGGMKMNMGGIFNKGVGSSAGEGAAAAEKTEGVSGADAAVPSESGKGDTAADLAAKLRLSFGRFGGSKDTKKSVGEGGEGGGAAAAAAAEAAVAGSSEKEKDSAFGSLFRKSFKAADVAAAFADLRDGPKSFGAAASAAAAGLTSATGGAAGGATGARQVVEIEEVTDGGVSGDGDDDDDDDAGELFVIGDDGSEASETTDSDFEGFDGEHRPPSSGGARSAADKELALLEHRLSGQIKGATMVVDDFLKVPGAKVFNVTKHKVTFHDRKPVSDTDDATGEADNGEEVSSTKDEGVAGGSEAEQSTDNADNETGNPAGDTADVAEKTSAPQEDEGQTEVKRVRVRAVTELERVVFLSRERILVLACPSGPTSPGLVKSNHHLTELQKMTFMRRDPALMPPGRRRSGTCTVSIWTTRRRSSESYGGLCSDSK
ncbi:unnamed protein product, partial [Scytosiphon promiscuus]